MVEKTEEKSLEERIADTKKAIRVSKEIVDYAVGEKTREFHERLFVGALIPTVIAIGSKIHGSNLFRETEYFTSAICGAFMAFSVAEIAKAISDKIDAVMLKRSYEQDIKKLNDHLQQLYKQGGYQNGNDGTLPV